MAKRCVATGIFLYTVLALCMMPLSAGRAQTLSGTRWTPAEAPDSQLCKQKATEVAPASSCAGRFRSLATLLPDGNALFAGPDNSAQIFETAVAAWRPAASMATPRDTTNSAIATLAGKGCPGRCGSVLAVGGGLSAELYDSDKNRWDKAADIPYLLQFPTATTLAGPGCASHCGHVLVVGSPGTSSAHLYDSRSDSWKRTGPMRARMVAHTATLLPDARVLVAGGYLAPDPAQAGASNPEISATFTQLYDPRTNRWSASRGMNEHRKAHSAVLLSELGCEAECNKVLVAGGNDNQGPANVSGAELFDIESRTWKKVASMRLPREFFAAAYLGNGKVAVAGGRPPKGPPETGSAETFDVKTRAWTDTAPMNAQRWSSSGVLLPSASDGSCTGACGGFLVVGGHGTAAATAEILTTQPSASAPPPPAHSRLSSERIPVDSSERGSDKRSLVLWSVGLAVVLAAIFTGYRLMRRPAEAGKT